jgi:hypothetical protein
MAQPRPGERVTVRDADGKPHEATALTGVVPGRDFPVVWVTFGVLDTAGTPWPADAVEASDGR